MATTTMVTNDEMTPAQYRMISIEAATKLSISGFIPMSIGTGVMVTAQKKRKKKLLMMQ